MKKMPAPEAERRVAQGQVLEHLQLRKADVHPVQISENVAQKQERDQAAVHLGIGFGFEAGIHSVTVVEGRPSGKEKGGHGKDGVQLAQGGGLAPLRSAGVLAR